MPAVARPRPRRLGGRAVAAALALTCLMSGTVAHAVTGVDVSRWQHGTSLNWAKAEADGVTFAFIKATEGTFYTNSYYAGDRAATKRVGIFRGAYHFARPSVGSAARQARYFVAHAGRVNGVGDLPPVLDLEATGGLGVGSLRTWTATWLRTTKQLTGRTPIIYTSPSFWESSLGNSTAFHAYPLWVAHYGTTHPRVPGGWPRWTFWQRTNQGHIDGINGDVDINRFHGTRAQLAALAHARPPSGGSGGDPGTGTTPDPGTGTTPDPGTGTTEPSPAPGPAPGPAPAEPARSATAVSLELSRDHVFPGGSVSFSGRLRSSDGAALPGRRVGLYRRAAGSTTWSRISSPTTDSTGRYTVTFAASGSATFRVAFAGGRRYAAAGSARRSLTVRPRIRTASTLDVDRSAREGRTAKVYGHLQTVAGTAVTDRTMLVYERLEGSARWRLVARSRTLSPTGWYQAYVTPSRTASYRAVFAGARALARSTSNTTTVRVR